VKAECLRGPFSTIHNNGFGVSEVVHRQESRLRGIRTTRHEELAFRALEPKNLGMQIGRGGFSPIRHAREAGNVYELGTTELSNRRRVDLDGLWVDSDDKLPRLHII